MFLLNILPERARDWDIIYQHLIIYCIAMVLHIFHLRWYKIYLIISFCWDKFVSSVERERDHRIKMASLHSPQVFQWKKDILLTDFIWHSENCSNFTGFKSDWSTFSKFQLKYLIKYIFISYQSFCEPCSEVLGMGPNVFNNNVLWTGENLQFEIQKWFSFIWFPVMLEIDIIP